MKKVIVVIATILLLGVWGQAWGANWFVDVNLADGNNDGTTTDHAWRGASAIKTAIEYGSYTAGDRVWIKRDSVYDEGVAGNNADIAPTDDGTSDAPIYIIGWPRGEISVTEGDWTNGSATVDNISGITCDREAHQARWAVGPDSNRYLITQVVDSDTIKIDREYVGTTVTDTDGAFTIEEDEDYDTAQAIDDSAWTIKLSTWTDDAHDVPTIDFNDEAYQLLFSGDQYYFLRNLNLIDSSDTNGILILNVNVLSELVGVLIKQSSSNARALYILGQGAWLSRVTIEGSGSGASQDLLYLSGAGIIFEGGAIYNAGSRSIYDTSASNVFLKNVNIGIEVSTGTDFYFSRGGEAAYRGIDVNFDGTVTNIGSWPEPVLSIENYGKVLGRHNTWHRFGTIAKLDVSAGSGDPYKRTGGASAVLDIVPNISLLAVSQDLGYRIFTHTYTSDGSSKTYRYYAQADALTTSATELWLEAEYVSAYDDATEYVMSTIRSDEALTQRSGADDWDEYLEVTVDPATASTVRIFLKINKYDSDGHIYVDPMVQIN